MGPAQHTEEKNYILAFFFGFYSHHSTAMHISATPTLCPVQHVALFLYYPWDHTFLFSYNQLVFPRNTSAQQLPGFSPFRYGALTKLHDASSFVISLSLPCTLHAPWFLVGSFLSHRDDSTPPPQIAAKNKASAETLFTSPAAQKRPTSPCLCSF